MKCIKCLTKNINQANYCKKCGYKFSDKEREAASRWTLVWCIKKAEKIKEICSGNFNAFGFITDTIAYKVISLLVVLAIGIYFAVANGLDVKIKESDNYKLQFNKEANEYYILVKEMTTLLDVYLPNDVENLTLTNYDYKDNVIIENVYNPNDEIVLKADSRDYYVLKAKQGKKESEFKMLVYLNGGE